MLNSEHLYIGSLIRSHPQGNSLSNKIAIITRLLDGDRFCCKYLHYTYVAGDYHTGRTVNFDPVVP